MQLESMKQLRIWPLAEAVAVAVGGQMATATLVTSSIVQRKSLALLPSILVLIITLGSIIQLSQAAHQQQQQAGRLHHKRDLPTIPDYQNLDTFSQQQQQQQTADGLASRKLAPASKLAMLTPPPPTSSSPSSSSSSSLSLNEQQIIQMLPTDNSNKRRQPTTTETPTTTATSSTSQLGNNSLATLLSGQSRPAKPVECPNGMLTFELSTGFIYKPSSGAETLAMMPSTLQLTDCLDYCLQNSSCLAINFEVGLCVLLATSAQYNQHNLYSSQFPVFTIYAEKKCLLSGEMTTTTNRHRRRCQRAWTFERVAGFEMKLRPKKRLKLASKELCMDACLSEHEFECRSANWYRQTGECTLSDQDRHSVSQSEAGDQQVKASLANFYGPATGVNQTQLTGAAAAAYQSYRRQTGHWSASSRATSRQQIAHPLAPAISKKHFKQIYGKQQQQKFAPGQRNMRQMGAPEDDWTQQLAGHINSAQVAGSPQTPLPSASDASAAGAMMSQHQYIDLPASALVVDYLENNCVYEPNKLCEFRKIQNRVLKTVDSIYQDVNSLDECKQKCLNAPYRCYSFDYGDTSERVCRTSHLDQASLLSVNEPYLEVVGAITYELATCFNVSIQCRAHEMVALVSSSKRFQGKIYAKSRPTSCVSDVTNGLEFELAMKYHDDACDVRASSSSSQGVFSNEIVIQHHDRIVTTQDMGLSVYCQYDLGNRSVTNNVDLSIEPIGDGPVESKQSESANGSHSNSGSGSSSTSSGGVHSPLTITGLATTVVRSPNVTMRITNMNGQPVTSATVGDRLALLFEVKEKTSPFGIFVREIVAIDGRQYLQQRRQLYLQHHANHSIHSVGHKHNSHGDDSFNSTSPSVLYYTSTLAPPGNNNTDATTTTTTSSTPHSIVNDSLIESMFQIDSVNSIQFIDSDGCPTDANLMGPLVKMDPQGHRLLAPFDAFKFPTSDMVFFRAVVTSCLAECKPAVCPNIYPTTPATSSHSLHSNSFANAHSNSIIPDESSPPAYSGDLPHPGIAQASIFNGDN